MKTTLTPHVSLLLASLLIVPLFGIEEPTVTAPNLVPEKPSTQPNYWCTWYAQNYWIKRGTNLEKLEGVTNEAAQNEINDHAIFNKKDGWATAYLPRGRKDFIFLIDHGWQTKDRSKFLFGEEAFFTFVAEEGDFPRYKGLPPNELLTKFNDEIKALGWNSLGIWVRGNLTKEQARKYVEWSKYAGIKYWKIDGGDTNTFNAFVAKQEIYPELVLEYVTGSGGNINPKWHLDLNSYPSVYDIGGTLQNEMLKVLQNTDTLRTYDASPLLMSVTTLRRTHDILQQTQQQSQYRGILNVQDDCNVAVGLGVLVSSKRHPNMNERTLQGKDLHHQLSGPRMMQKRMNEAERFGRWSRIAPAFPAGEGVYLSSDEELIDRCLYTQWDTWNEGTYGKMVSQSAPAIMARNMPLPKVECDGPHPYVCATTYPNGPTGIATEGRVSPENRWFEPLAKVSVQIKDASQPIGIVGNYKELVLTFAGPIEGAKHVWAQDLLADKAMDIRSRVVVAGNTLTIPGEVIKAVGRSAGDKGDISAPGMVLRLEGAGLPVAGKEFTPVTKPVTTAKAMVRNSIQYEDGYSGNAALTKKPYGYLVTGSKGSQVVLKKLPKSISTGTINVAWKMKSEQQNALRRNGFIVLSSDEDANAAICAGAWIGSNKITLFESRPNWGEGHYLTKSYGSTNAELNCELVVNLDQRTASLTVGGEKLDLRFTETVTSINYVGFGVHENAETLFSVPTVKTD